MFDIVDEPRLFEELELELSPQLENKEDECEVESNDSVSLSNISSNKSFSSSKLSPFSCQPHNKHFSKIL